MYYFGFTCRWKRENEVFHFILIPNSSGLVGGTKSVGSVDAELFCWWFWGQWCWLGLADGTTKLLVLSWSLPAPPRFWLLRRANSQHVLLGVFMQVP